MGQRRECGGDSGPGVGQPRFQSRLCHFSAKWRLMMVIASETCQDLGPELGKHRLLFFMVVWGSDPGMEVGGGQSLPCRALQPRPGASLLARRDAGPAFGGAPGPPAAGLGTPSFHPLPSPHTRQHTLSRIFSLWPSRLFILQGFL